MQARWSITRMTVRRIRVRRESSLYQYRTQNTEACWCNFESRALVFFQLEAKREGQRVYVIR